VLLHQTPCRSLQNSGLAFSSGQCKGALGFQKSIWPFEGLILMSFLVGIALYPMLSETSKPLAIVNSYVIFLVDRTNFLFYAKFTGDEY
jgi:hypothetical protein